MTPIYALLAGWKKDFDGTLKAVARMGYEGVELNQILGTRSVVLEQYRLIHR